MRIVDVLHKAMLNLCSLTYSSLRLREYDCALMRIRTRLEYVGSCVVLRIEIIIFVSAWYILSKRCMRLKQIEEIVNLDVSVCLLTNLKTNIIPKDYGCFIKC